MAQDRPVCNIYLLTDCLALKLKIMPAANRPTMALPTPILCFRLLRLLLVHLYLERPHQARGQQM